MRKDERAFNIDELLKNVLGSELFKRFGLGLENGLVISMSVSTKLNSDER